jgi:hypothetical protein
MRLPWALRSHQGCNYRGTASAFLQPEAQFEADKIIVL